ncbi:MAG TPA: AGE family epimerase/isomerase [Opitutaceae bacterium]|nr:AGE family epimerase/isomerase [Opitutaceae bacterium]
MTPKKTPIRLAALAGGLLFPISGAFGGAAPAVPAAELADLSKGAEQELRGNILPFWLKYARDREHGGFHSFIGEDMTVRDDLPRGALLTSRILWTFSAAYRAYRDPEYLEMARWAYRDLVDRFVDKQDGGLFWSVRPDGQPAEAHKQIYGQVFGIYGLCEYYRATGDIAALQQAVAIYGLIEKNAHDPVNGGYFDTLNRGWQREDKKGGNMLGPAPKSQNSHIHILEGFTNLLRVWPDEGLRQRERELIELTMSRIIDPKTHHLILFMKDDWTPVGDGVSYGHDIELSWLLVEAADVLGDRQLAARARQEAVEIARVTNAQGVDTDGGVYSEGDPKGPTNMDKEWWEQAEAAVGFLNAYQISGDPAYLADSARSWRFIQDKFVDRQHGDWHNTLARDGTPILEMKGPFGRSYPSAKVSVWKCPYHNSRSCLQLIERADELLGRGAGG